MLMDSSTKTTGLERTRRTSGITKRPRRPSAISTILRHLEREPDQVPLRWQIQGRKGSRYRVHVAADRRTRERAYRLARQVYQASDYLEESSKALAVSSYDALPDTFTLLVEDETGRDAATVTLVFDAGRGLPCDEIYGEELDALRQSGKRLVEVTRLAISANFRNDIDLLLTLFNFIYIFARRVRNYSDFVIEVNPKHVKYYQRLLHFEIEGPERSCPRVRGAPAVLLRQDIAQAETEIERARCTDSTSRLNRKNLYAHAVSHQEERNVARFLEARHAPMSSAEKRHFDLASKT